MANWFNKSPVETEKALNTNNQDGLKDEEVVNRQKQYGYNELKAKKKKSIIIKFMEQFKDFMIIILIISAIVSGAIGIIEGEGITDTIIILLVVIVNAVIGVLQENKAEKSLEALQKLSNHVAKVMRNGRLTVIPAKELVPGDVVILETGDYVPADLRLIEAVNLKAQESALTGESVPVEKDTKEIVEEKVSLGDRTNMLFSSSLITYGRGKGIVVATAMETEVGKIAGIINETENTQTPLQIRLNKLGKTLGIAALIICAVIFCVGMLYGKEPIHMFMSAVSLAVAAIPEGLPAVSTIVLAVGVQRMVKKNAIIKNLPSVETLGCSSVICSDKTGTLTQNKMTVKKLFVNNSLIDVSDVEEINDELKLILQAGMLCNDTKIGEGNTLTGDPTETALVDLGFNLGVDKVIYENSERIGEIPFDSERKLMSTVHKIGEKYVVYTKGAVDELIKRCSGYCQNQQIKMDLENYKSIIGKNNEIMAKSALRVLAVAYKELEDKPDKEQITNIENNLIFVGMFGMIDPPREEAMEAVEKCKTAGIKPVMITGDHKITATAIAKQLGILKEDSEAITGNELEEMSQEELEKNIEHYSVYARVSPEHKVRIVRAWQKNGNVVAMTGDGVNDAPALKTADIGCAMGIVGTDVAKEAADVILTDDNFATVVSAVEEGRRIYDNILKAIQFLLSSNVGEIITLLVAILITPVLASIYGLTDISHLEPLLPIHILWINLVTDSLQALALSVDPASNDIMKRKPKKAIEGVFTKGMVWRIAYQGIMIGTLTLIAYCIGLSTPNQPDLIRIEIGQTMAFIVLAFSQLVHVFNIRNNKISIFKTGIGGNSKLILATIVSAVLMLVILCVPALRNIFNLVALPMENIVEVITLIFTPIVIVEIFKLLKINTSKDE